MEIDIIDIDIGNTMPHSWNCDGLFSGLFHYKVEEEKTYFLTLTHWRGIDLILL